MARKIFAGTLMGLSLILLSLGIAGIMLAWIYNEPLTLQATAKLTEIDGEMAQARIALQNAKTEIERTLRIVEDAEKALATLKDELSQAKEMFGVVQGTLDEKLTPGLQSTRAKIGQVKSTLQDLRDTLERLNSIPLIQLNLPGDELLASWIEIANSMDAQIAQVEDLTQKASTFMSDMSYLSGADLSETKQNLKDFLAVINEYDQKVAGWQAQVAGLIASLPGWVDSASVILTVILFWFGFSQISLFLHALEWWQGGDPLAMLRKPAQEDIQI